MNADAKFRKILEASRCRGIEVAEPDSGHPFRRRCQHYRLDGNDLCLLHTDLEASGRRVRRVTEPRKGSR